MIYLKDYDNYNTNEKVSWKDILFWSVLFLGTRQIGGVLGEYRLLNNLYNQINSTTSKPSVEDSTKLESIRLNLLDEISKSPRWEKFGKTNLIDSLSKVKFKVVDSLPYSTNISENSSACFINLEAMKDRTRFIVKKFINEPTENNLIVVRKDMMNSKELQDVLIHEIYHYLDKLLIVNNDLSKFVDMRIKSDRNYASKKICILMKNHLLEYNSKVDINSFSLIDSKKKDVDLYAISKSFVDPYQDRFSYYSSPEEIFARWWTLKTDMVREGILQNLEVNVSLEDISNYLDSVDNVKKGQCYDVMMVLDWEKIEDLQSNLIQ